MASMQLKGIKHNNQIMGGSVCAIDDDNDNEDNDDDDVDNDGDVDNDANDNKDDE
jgi:hypothetical protein